MIDLNFNIFNILVFIILAIIYFVFMSKNRQLSYIIILRVILFILLIIILFKVNYKISAQYKKINFAIVIDNSYSMKFNNRLEKIKKMFFNINTELKKHTNLNTYFFNKEVALLEENAKFSWAKNLTDIKSSLEKIVYKNKNLDAILLFTDGNDSYNRYPDLYGSKIKIYPIDLDEKNFSDISIKDVRYSQIGFKGIEHEFSCHILNYGYEGKNLNISLESENEVLDIKKINLKTGYNEVKLKFIPKDIGRKKFLIKLEKLPNEVTYENNIKNFEIEIKKNKIRILYICGQPSYEYYFLRSLLKNDPNVDLVSFIILRNSDSQAIVPDEDLSLIPFPIYDIFVKEINNYDLILFENFSYRKFSIPLQYLDNVRKYVFSGGGFIMLGGENSFSSGGYKNTPIEEILPVELFDNEQIIEEEFELKINKFNNQLLKIYEDIKNNEMIWRFVPRLKNYHRFVAKPSSEVLISNNNDIFKGSPVPIMVYWTVGKGRVFVSGTNTTWMWGLANMLSKNYDLKNLYTQFWKNIIYWCSGVGELKKIHILFDRENFSVDDVIKVRIVIFDEHDIMPDLWVTFPDLSKKKVNLKKMSLEYIGEIELPLEGKYVFSVYLNNKNDSYKEVREIYVEKGVIQEIANLKINEKYLNKLAEMYNGKVINYNNLNINSLIEDVRKKISKEYITSYDIYTSPILIILFIIIFLLEIYLVRRIR